MNMCRIEALLLVTKWTIHRMAYAYFVRVCKNLASTKKHLAADLFLSSVLCIGSQFLSNIPFFLPFSYSTVLNLGKERFYREALSGNLNKISAFWAEHMKWGKRWGRKAALLLLTEAQQWGAGRIGKVLLHSPIAPSIRETAQLPHSVLSMINGGLRLFPCTRLHHSKAWDKGKLGSAKNAAGTNLALRLHQPTVKRAKSNPEQCS